MSARKLLWIVLVGSVFAPQFTAAAPPWSKVGFKRLEADPQELYPIDDTRGPWMIMAATFSGEGSEDQARQLIHELRKDYKLSAYSYRKKFEYSKPVEGKGLTPQGERVIMRYNQDHDVTEIAVLVGDFPSVEDLETQKVLKKLKYLRPKSLDVTPDQSHQALAGYRMLQKMAKEATGRNDQSLQRGPMGNAFVITNPVLPPEYFVPKGIDKLVLDMNSNVRHSLLDCPQPYSVQVATFTGSTFILDKKRQDAIDRGELPPSKLEEAAKNAHLLTEALRKKGYEAYEFHDRGQSIVTVGSFASVGSKRPDGKIEINPAMHAIIKTFGAQTTAEPGKAPEIGRRKKLAGIPFDIQPMPVEVPRETISGAYDRTAATR